MEQKNIHTQNIINMNEHTTGYSLADINTYSVIALIYEMCVCVCMLTQQKCLLIYLAKKDDLK